MYYNNLKKWLEAITVVHDIIILFDIYRIVEALRGSDPHTEETKVV